jgi:hypothetical protein
MTGCSISNITFKREIVVWSVSPVEFISPSNIFGGLLRYHEKKIAEA